MATLKAIETNVQNKTNLSSATADLNNFAAKITASLKYAANVATQQRDLSALQDVLNWANTTSKRTASGTLVDYIKTSSEGLKFDTAEQKGGKTKVTVSIAQESYKDDNGKPQKRDRTDWKFKPVRVAQWDYKKAKTEKDLSNFDFDKEIAKKIKSAMVATSRDALKAGATVDSLLENKNCTLTEKELTNIQKKLK